MDLIYINLTWVADGIHIKQGFQIGLQVYTVHDLQSRLTWKLELGSKQSKEAYEHIR